MKCLVDPLKSIPDIEGAKIYKIIHECAESHPFSKIAFEVEYESNDENVLWLRKIFNGGYNIIDAYCCVSEGNSMRYRCVLSEECELDGSWLSSMPDDLKKLQLVVYHKVPI